MTLRTFVYNETEQLGANQPGSIRFTVPTNETWTVQDIWFQSTGDFAVTGIQDADSNQYIFGTTSNPLGGEFFKDINDDFHAVNPFDNPIQLGGSNELTIYVIDESGAVNDVECAILILRDQPGN